MALPEDKRLASKKTGRWWTAFIPFLVIVPASLAAGIVLLRLKENASAQSRMAGIEIIRPPHEVAVIVGREGKIWAGGRDGTWKLDPNGTANFETLECKTTLVYVRALLPDGDGGLWIGHSMGLASYSVQGCNNLADAGGQAFGQVNSLLQDREGLLWVGTDHGAAILEDEEWRWFTTADGLLHGNANVMFEDSSGGLWFGSFVAPDGGLTFCTDENCSAFTIGNGLPHNNITSISQDRNGDVWVGTGYMDRGGAVRFEQSGTGWEIRETLDQSFGLAGNKVRSIFQDRDGVMWFGSEYDGLARVDQGGAIVLDVKDGLSSPEVKTIYQDEDGNLWLGTMDGITLIRKAALETLAAKG